MKKIYLFFAALLCLCVSACSNDDIEIEAYTSGSLTLRVTTQSVYDSFGIKDRMEDTFLRDGYKIGVTSFVYDANGQLYAKLSSSSENFNRVEQKFQQIKDGTYTIVTVQSLADSDDENPSLKGFSFEQENSLRTLRLKQKSRELADIYAVGLNTTKVTVKGKEAIIDVTPKAIGSRLVVSYNNSAEYLEYDYFGFSTKDIIDAYLLDPSIQREDRYQMNLSSSNGMNVRGKLTSESVDDNYINTLYVLEKEIEYCFCYHDVSDGNSWYISKYYKEALEDGKVYYAGMYVAEDGYYYVYLGSKEEYTEWLNEMKNYVPEPEPETLLYETPYTDWANGSVSKVKQWMSNHTLTVDIKLTSSGEDYYMQYRSQDETDIYQYNFQTRTSGLTDAYVVMSKDEANASKIKSHLEEEGYEVGSYNNDYEFYPFNNETTKGLFYLDDDGDWVVNYYDPNAYASTRKMKLSCAKTSLKTKSSSQSRAKTTMVALNDNVLDKGYTQVRLSDL